MKSQQTTNAFVKEIFMDLKTQLETIAKNHQASIQNLETKFDRLADKQSGRPSVSLLSNTQPNTKGHNSKAYQPPQSHNEHVNVIFTRSDKSYNPPVNPNDQQNDSKTPINSDSDDENETYTITENSKSETIQGNSVAKTIQTKNSVSSTPKERENGSSIRKISRHDPRSMIQNKVPPKLKDPKSFLIPCNFNKTFSCNALADLGASINLMPYSLYVKLLLKNLKPTKMSVRLADRSFQYPVRIEMEEDSKVPLILGRPYLHTADASYLNDDTCFSIDVIDEILEEEFDALLDEGSKIIHFIKGTLLEEEIFAEFDEFIAMIADENFDSEFDTEDPPFEKITINTDYKIKTSLEEGGALMSLRVVSLVLLRAYSNLTLLVAERSDLGGVLGLVGCWWEEHKKIIRTESPPPCKISTVDTNHTLSTSSVSNMHITMKRDAKPRLIRWILLLQEFDIEIKVTAKE
ncbi:reverse transcriptase domain-containing protein [Tanacetum coccineum]